jgi:hypothetical protein
MEQFQIELVTPLASEKQLQYLRNEIPEKCLLGFGKFIQEQAEVFEKYSQDLEVVFSAFANAPNELNMKPLEEALVQYLKEQGVSATRVSIIKGAIRLRKLLKNNPHFYRPEDPEILVNLKSEKAYLASRMTFEGQRKVCDLIREKGNVPVKEMRSLLKEHEYDQSAAWKDGLKRISIQSQLDKLGQELRVPKGIIPPQIVHLVSNLALLIDDLVDQYDLWEADPRVHEMVDRDSLVKLTKAFCVNWYVSSNVTGSPTLGMGYDHPRYPGDENNGYGDF